MFSVLFFCCLFFYSGRILAQFDPVGGDLHGVQTDGGVVGQRRAGLHQSQRHRLEKVEIHVLEEIPNAQLPKGEVNKVH